MRTLPQTKDEVIKILKDLKISLFDYEIHEDLSVSIYQDDVDLRHKKLNYIPLNFNEVHGNFDCSYNNLISLQGAPKKVTNSFSAHHNKINFLRDLPQCPNIYVQHNNIRYLDYIPEETVVFDLSNNLIHTISVTLLDKYKYKLTKLVLANNNISSGIDHLRNCQDLRKIWLENNKLTDIADFKYFPKLKILDLKDNRLTDFNWTEEFSEKIVSVLLSHNKIKNIYINPNMEIHRLETYNNQVESIQVHPNTIINTNDYKKRSLIEKINFYQKYTYSIPTTLDKYGTKLNDKIVEKIKTDYLNHLKKELYLLEHL